MTDEPLEDFEAILKDLNVAADISYRCPRCGKGVPPAAASCLHCGYDLKPPVASPARKPARQYDDMLDAVAKLEELGRELIQTAERLKERPPRELPPPPSGEEPFEEPVAAEATLPEAALAPTADAMGIREPAPVLEAATPAEASPVSTPAVSASPATTAVPWMSSPLPGLGLLLVGLVLYVAPALLWEPTATTAVAMGVGAVAIVAGAHLYLRGLRKPRAAQR